MVMDASLSFQQQHGFQPMLLYLLEKGGVVAREINESANRRFPKRFGHQQAFLEVENEAKIDRH